MDDEQPFTPGEAVLFGDAEASLDPRHWKEALFAAHDPKASVCSAALARERLLHAIDLFKRVPGSGPLGLGSNERSTSAPFFRELFERQMQSKNGSRYDPTLMAEAALGCALSLLDTCDDCWDRNSLSCLQHSIAHMERATEALKMLRDSSLFEVRTVLSHSLSPRIAASMAHMERVAAECVALCVLQDWSAVIALYPGAAIQRMGGVPKRIAEPLSRSLVIATLAQRVETALQSPMWSDDSAVHGQTQSSGVHGGGARSIGFSRTGTPPPLPLVHVLDASVLGDNLSRICALIAKTDSLFPIHAPYEMDDPLDTDRLFHSNVHIDAPGASSMLDSLSQLTDCSAAFLYALQIRLVLCRSIGRLLVLRSECTVVELCEALNATSAIDVPALVRHLVRIGALPRWSIENGVLRRR